MTDPVLSAVERVGKQFNETAADLSARLGELEKRAARSEHYVAANDNGGVVSLLLANREFGTFDYNTRRHQRIDLGGGLGDAMAAITSGPSTVGNV